MRLLHFLSIYVLCHQHLVPTLETFTVTLMHIYHFVLILYHLLFSRTRPLSSWGSLPSASCPGPSPPAWTSPSTWPRAASRARSLCQERSSIAPASRPWPLCPGRRGTNNRGCGEGADKWAILKMKFKMLSPLHPRINEPLCLFC